MPARQAGLNVQIGAAVQQGTAALGKCASFLADKLNNEKSFHLRSGGDFHVGNELDRQLCEGRMPIQIRLVLS